MNNCWKFPLQVNCFRWRHFALPSMCLTIQKYEGPPPPFRPPSLSSPRIAKCNWRPCSRIHSLWLGYKVNSGLGLLYGLPPCWLHRLARQYDNPMPELTISPRHGIWIWPLNCEWWRGAFTLGKNSRILCRCDAPALSFWYVDFYVKRHSWSQLRVCDTLPAVNEIDAPDLWLWDSVTPLNPVADGDLASD